MFIEVRFPECISYGSVGGPRYFTRLHSSGSGYEYRNAVWNSPLHAYDAAYGVKTQDHLEDLIQFFNSMQGRANTFRWKDWLDYKSCDPYQNINSADQLIGIGDGVNDTFQLVKNYTATDGTNTITTTRTINKPTDTVQVEVGGVLQTPVTNYTIDLTTGVIVFEPGSIPADTLEVRAGFEYDVPARFDLDMLDIQLDSSDGRGFLGSTSVPVVEVRL